MKAARFPLIAAICCAAVAAAVSACAPQQTIPVSADTQTTVLVENQGFSDMTIYVLQSTTRVRLGLAPGASKTTFEIPAYVRRNAETLRFIADPIGTMRASVSQEISVHPGDRVTMQIPPG